MDAVEAPSDMERPASAKLGWTAEEENARLAAIVNSSPDAIISFAAEDGRIVTWNPAATRLFGYTEEEAIGGPVSLLLPDPSPEGPTGVFSRAMAGEAVQVESIRRRKDGVLLNVAITASRIVGADGRILGVSGMFRDITAQKRMAMTLEAVMANIPEGLTIADAPDGRIRMVSAHGLRLVNGNEDTLIGMPAERHAEHLQVYDRQGERKLSSDELPLTRAIRHGETVEGEICRMQLADGVKLPVLCSAAPIRDHNGRVTGGIVAWRDISASLAAEEALRTASERVELALNSGAIQGTWVWEIAEDRFTGDERFARCFALDPDQCRAGISMRSVLRTIHPEDRPEVERRSLAAMRQGGSYSAEYRVRQADGSYRWIQANGRCDLDAAGRPIRFPGVLIDIHDRKLMEDRLRRSEAEAREATHLLRTIIEAVPVQLYVKDRDGRYQIANRPLLELFGRDWSEVEGRTDAEFLAPDHAAAIMANDRRIMAAGLSESVEEFAGGTPDGPRIWLSTKTAFRNDAGELVGIVGTSVDITARKETEARLQEAMEQYRAMGETVPYGAWLCGPDGGVRYFSPSFLELLNCTMEQAAQFGWIDRLVPEDIEPTRERWLECVAAGEPWEAVHRILDRNGELHHVLSRGRPIRDAWGRVTSWAGISLDITEQRRTEQARQLLVRELNHRVKNLFAIAAGMVLMTARSARSTEEMAEALSGRLMALARAHELIRPAISAEAPDQDGTTLGDIVTAVVAPHLLRETDSLPISGPPIHVGPNAATSLALLFHELATNAAKYGALSVPDGTLRIDWHLDGERMMLTWSETGAPEIPAPPANQGFGSQLARMSATGQLGGDIRYEWNRRGVRIVLTAQLDYIAR